MLSSSQLTLVVLELQDFFSLLLDGSAIDGDLLKWV